MQKELKHKTKEIFVFIRSKIGDKMPQNISKHLFMINRFSHHCPENIDELLE